MPTPDVKGAASIIQRTGGLFSPYSIEASNTAFVAFSVLSRGTGVKPTSCISRHATPNMTSRTPTRSRKGTPSEVACAITPPATDPPSIAIPPIIWPRPSTDSRPPSYSA